MSRGRTRMRGKALVIDDDPVVLEATRERLQRLGFSVVIRDTGLGATNTMRSEEPDFVLVDVDMPALRGDSVTRFLRGATVSGRTAAIFLHSSALRASLDSLARECGATGVIEKTGDELAFRRQLEECLASARRAAQ